MSLFCGLDGRFWQIQTDSPRVRAGRRVSQEPENASIKRGEKRDRSNEEASVVEALLPAPEAPEGGIGPEMSPAKSVSGKKFRGLREIQRLSSDSFDGRYWTSPAARPSSGSPSSRLASSSSSSSSSNSPGAVSDTVLSASASEEGSSRWRKPLAPQWITVQAGNDVVVRFEDEQIEMKAQALEEEKIVEVPKEVEVKGDSNQVFSGNDGASYLHSEAARLYESRHTGTIIVPDLNGQISMDGDYWKISETGRSRRRRELQFFPPTLKLGSTSTAPRLPRAPLSPGTVERRKRAQQAIAAELRAEREQRDAEYADLVRFESSGREIVSGLFLGGVVAAENTSWVCSSVDFVVNVSGKTQPYSQVFGADQVLRIDEADNEHANLFQHFVPVATQIEALIASGRRVLVHCYQGKSRSAALVAAYLVLKHSMSLIDALSLISSKNRGHKINPGFMSQLEKLECQHNGLQNSSVFQHKDTRRQ